MNFPRLLVVTGALAATASVVPDDVAAQSLTIEETISAQSTWTSGYMALGGGLARTMPNHDAKKTVSAVPERRAVRRPAVQVTRPVFDRSTPIALIADTLDHTGENIATLGARAGSR